MDLGDYLTLCGKHRWQWGVYDCCTFPADWLMLCRGVDPMEPWRGLYHDEAGCIDILAEAGGLVPLWTRGLGEQSAEAARPGDVAVVGLWGHEAGAIWTGQRWAVRAPRGLSLTDTVEVKAVWRG